jgi:hypothetical protein
MPYKWRVVAMLWWISFFNYADLEPDLHGDGALAQLPARGRYAMDDGHIVVDSIVPIEIGDITYDLARESGFASVEDLLQTAKHGPGTNVYLIRFHYLPPGAWH